jgi:alpha-beta hydrolase superfamily lysophospholipase
MLVVHGIGEHSGRYEHLGATLAAAGIDVASYDQRGFGETAGARGHVDAFADHLDDLQPILDERRTLGVPVILMGHSLGGLVVSTYLTSDRPQPDIAVLSAPALAAEMPTWQRKLAPILGKITPKLGIPADFDGSILSRDAAVQAAYENDPLRVATSTARLGREILAAMSAVGRTLDRLRVPTYVLHGSADTLVPPAATEVLADLPTVTRRVWEGLRHECLNEPEQDAVVAEVIAWIDVRLGEVTND